MDAVSGAAQLVQTACDFALTAVRKPPLLEWQHSSFYVRKNNIGGHPGAQFVLVVRQPNFYAENLTDSVFDRLHIAGGKFGLAINLLDRAVEILSGKRIDPDANRIPPP